MIPVLLLLSFVHTGLNDLSASVNYWQREMGLWGWFITVEVVDRNRLDQRTVGHIDANCVNRTAVIRVLDVRDSDLPLREALADQLLTVAHEMVHLKRLVKDRSPNWRDEAATERQTLALLLKHKRWQELSVYEK